MATKGTSSKSTKSGRSTTKAKAAGGRASTGKAKSRGAASRGGGQKLSKTTTDHDEIRQWAEERGAKPACVMGTGGKGDTGLVRLDFPGFSGAGKLQEISWEDFFEKFDEQKLTLVYQDVNKAGQKSNFNKLVARDGSPRGGGNRAAGAKGGRARAAGRSHGRTSK